MPQELPFEQLSQAVIDSLAQHIAMLDHEGRIIAINRAWRRFYSGNGGDKTGIAANYLEACRDLGGEANLAEAGVRAVLAGADEFKMEYPCDGPQGKLWFLMQVAPLPHSLGGAVVSHLDITSRKQIEAERARLLADAQQAREIAEAANRAKDEFLAQIMHDLRAPLSAILGWTKVMRSRSLDGETQAEALTVIEQSAEKQKLLIEDLLDISRIVSGKLRLDVRPVSLSEVIRSAMEVMRPACEAKEVDCGVELTTEADAITGDPARLEQVIWNLVSNAVKFTPYKGQVAVRLERADPFVRITVTDTGKGIKSEHLPHIFQRYWQSAEAGGRRTGLGLGLSFVKHIVELHGGTVEAESEGEGKGARFIINLPYRAVGVHANEAAGTAEPFFTMPRTRTSLRELLIVVVDDEADARDLVATVLRQQGAEVLTAGSAQEAFRLIAEASRTPHLLVSDISMPLEDGYSLIRKVRVLPPQQGGRIPAVALTAFGRMEDRIRALTAGFQMHLPKPVEPAELVLVAANLTGREIEGFQR
jgi:signal transduction histidine kinase/CheY-like chemotaxis protein